MDYTLLLVCLAGFAAGFIDAIIGGGGLVQVPSLFILYPQFVVPQVIGTNRFASFMGTSVAAWQYGRKIKFPVKTILAAGVGAALMAYLGAQLSSKIDQTVLKSVILLLMTGIALYTFSQKSLGDHQALPHESQSLLLKGLAVGSAIGFYNGFVGPGTGSLLVFGFVAILRYNFLTASGIAKVVNVVADVASLGFFLLKGYVQFEIALPMMLCNMLGSFAGSRLAILKGNRFVRTFFLVVVAALILRFGYDVLKTW